MGIRLIMSTVFNDVCHMYYQGYSVDMAHQLLHEKDIKVSKEYIEEVYYDLMDEEQDGFIDYSE